VLNAISRYGARIIPNTEQTIHALRARGHLVTGPHVVEFERALAARVDAQHAIATSYGRMAFLYILRAFDFPPGSEVVIPALTFWVIPELARVAGLRPVFADIDPETFTLDPRAFERAITARTRAVVPTHLYGLPCDMSAILGIARRAGITVIEDCAHALGATYQGRPVGTLGDAGFFSFQLLKPLNAYGGGMAVTNDPSVARRVAECAARAKEPSENDVLGRLRFGRAQRVMIKPRVFSATLFPILWTSSWFNATPDVYLWESIRSLSPLPDSYEVRFSNVQAAIGLEGLAQLDGWIARTRAHAARVTETLAGVPAVRTPVVPPDRTHVFYQYAIYAADRGAVVRRCLRRGIDVETLHVDVCTRLDLFRLTGGSGRSAPGAEHAAEAIQLPIYESLSDDQVGRVAHVVRQAVAA
jgi:dTDP-4-amino-4,6-dideoxygalactose transaminase